MSDFLISVISEVKNTTNNNTFKQKEIHELENLVVCVGLTLAVINTNSG